MGKLDSKTVEHYQDLLSKDPNSKVFAALAEAYREMNLLEQAEAVARRGVAKHPQYAPGYVVWGRILMDQQKYSGAVKLLTKATELSPDNLLAHHLLGQAHLALENPKEALKAHKLALFLNPQDERSRHVVEKLESLTADEYDDDIFEMRPLKPEITPTPSTLPSAQEDLDRVLSLIDALIVRNEINRALQLLLDAEKKYPGSTLVQSRLEMLQAEGEEPSPIKPLPQKEKLVLEGKIKTLQKILDHIQQRQRELG